MRYGTRAPAFLFNKHANKQSKRYYGLKKFGKQYGLSNFLREIGRYRVHPRIYGILIGGIAGWAVSTKLTYV